MGREGALPLFLDTVHRDARLVLRSALRRTGLVDDGVAGEALEVRQVQGQLAALVVGGGVLHDPDRLGALTAFGLP